MRGKDGLQVRVCQRSGITPAYAGKRPKDGTAKKADGDHPRLCGEKCCFPFIPFHSVGSPPPMRGKVSCPVGGFFDQRITPAYAGKSKFHGSCLCITWDHPRLCGEKTASLCTVITWSGSPPPMRGKAVNGIVKYNTLGITPAYAGKSTQILWNCFFDQDHPRLCGEK